MTDSFNTWLFVSLFVGGAAVAIIVFLRTTPREFWFRHPPQMSIADKLKQFPESAQAVLIKGNKKLAILLSLPYICVLAIIYGISLWVKHSACESIFGVNASHVLFLAIVYGFPLFFLALALHFSVSGYKIIKHGYAPPLDSVHFHDVIAKKGRSSLINGVLSLIAPILVIPLLYLGHIAYTELTKGTGFHGLESHLSEKCK